MAAVMDAEGNAVSELEELTLALLHSRAEVERLGEREQLFSSLLGSVNAVLWAFDWNEQRMIYVSPAYERIFGRSAALLLALPVIDDQLHAEFLFEEPFLLAVSGRHPLARRREESAAIASAPSTGTSAR